jgi:hypothetical protein
MRVGMASGALRRPVVKDFYSRVALLALDLLVLAGERESGVLVVVEMQEPGFPSGGGMALFAPFPFPGEFAKMRVGMAPRALGGPVVKDFHAGMALGAVGLLVPAGEREIRIAIVIEIQKPDRKTFRRMTTLASFPCPGKLAHVRVAVAAGALSRPVIEDSHPRVALGAVGLLVLARQLEGTHRLVVELEVRPAPSVLVMASLAAARKLAVVGCGVAPLVLARQADVIHFLDFPFAFFDGMARFAGDPLMLTPQLEQRLVMIEGFGNRRNQTVFAPLVLGVAFIAGALERAVVSQVTVQSLGNRLMTGEAQLVVQPLPPVVAL